MDKPLAGKTALVTGGAKRIGRAIALSLAEHGADVAVTYLGSQVEAEQTVRDLARLRCGRVCGAVRPGRSQGYHARWWPLSPTSSGVFDILVNNAGFFESAPLEASDGGAVGPHVRHQHAGAFPAGSGGASAPAIGGRANHQHRLAGRHPPVGDAWPLLHVEGGSAHALADDGEGMGARDQRELRCARDDRAGGGWAPGTSSLRTRPRCGATGQRQTLPRPFSFSRRVRTSSPDSCWRLMAAWASNEGQNWRVACASSAEHPLPPAL